MMEYGGFLGPNFVEIVELLGHFSEQGWVVHTFFHVTSGSLTTFYLIVQRERPAA